MALVAGLGDAAVLLLALLLDAVLEVRDRLPKPPQ